MNNYILNKKKYNKFADALNVYRYSTNTDNSINESDNMINELENTKNTILPINDKITEIVNEVVLVVTQNTISINPSQYKINHVKSLPKLQEKVSSLQKLLLESNEKVSVDTIQKVNKSFDSLKTNVTKNCRKYRSKMNVLYKENIDLFNIKKKKNK